MEPVISRIVESSLYVDDLERASAFYRNVLGFRVLDASTRLVAMDAGQSTVLLLFRRGATLDGVDMPTGRIPPHDGHGPVHLAFAVPADQLAAWEERLARHGVAIESRASWTLGGKSIYFRDPDDHSLELVTPGTWPTY
jgi:catechol 2,3-dioxygenase-like lactoylglutathione lyase family enzyme